MMKRQKSMTGQSFGKWWVKHINVKAWQYPLENVCKYLFIFLFYLSIHF